MPGELRDEFDKDARRMKQELARNFVASIGGMEEESPKDGRSKDVAALVGGTQNVSTENAESKDLADLVGGTKNISTEKGELKDVAALVGGTTNVSTENEELKDVAPLILGMEDSSTEEGTEEDQSTLYGFEREGMYKLELAGTVNPHHRHFFFCCGSYESWPPYFDEKSGFLVPCLLISENIRTLSRAPKPSRLTICEKNKNARIFDGNVLVFPDMQVYRRLRLKPSEVHEFVDEVIVKGKRWCSSGFLEDLRGSYIFVCAHKRRDKRCSACGPPLIKKFNEVIEAKDLKRRVFVLASSHIGGDRNSSYFAGNVIIFSRDSEGKVAGNWYGYVTPNDVAELIEEQILKGEIVERLWRGQMGIADDESSVAFHERHNHPAPITVKAKAKQIIATWTAAAGIMLAMASAAAATIAAYGIYRRRRIR
ncbi:uncharacterized protein LOC127258283 [Andrographis paniculata]|uniref:uncharacterized protein LOC127258283 n=1 Tax=Andrographis paniculata TaxID=175694 RepID=UPI0021E9156A|nr:uncharacterized protein LOC127258283 [Andrographis paniculata]